MPYWLCFTPTVKCDGQCILCGDRSTPIELHAVHTEQRPDCAVNGPALNLDELLGIWKDYFEFKPDGRLQPKQIKRE